MLPSACGFSQGGVGKLPQHMHIWVSLCVYGSQAKQTSSVTHSIVLSHSQVSITSGVRLYAGYKALLPDKVQHATYGKPDTSSIWHAGRLLPGSHADDAASASGMSTLTNDEDEAVQLLDQPGREQEVDSDFEREFTQLVGTHPSQSVGSGSAGGQAGQASAQEASAQEEDNGTVDFKVMLRKGAKPRSVQVQPCAARKSHGAADLADVCCTPVDDGLPYAQCLKIH